jgi:hypothetical protein
VPSVQSMALVGRKPIDPARQGRLKVTADLAGRGFCWASLRCSAPRPPPPRRQDFPCSGRSADGEQGEQGPLQGRACGPYTLVLRSFRQAQVMLGHLELLRLWPRMASGQHWPLLMATALSCHSSLLAESFHRMGWILPLTQPWGDPPHYWRPPV